VRAPAHPSAEQAESTDLRLTFLALLVVSLFVLLVARLWFLQVLVGEELTAQAQGNAIRTVTLEAPRGKILDRRGTPIVRNRSAAVVSVQPGELGDRADEVYAALADVLGDEVEELQRRAESAGSSPHRPRPVAIDVDIDAISYIHEHGAERFPGVYAETLPLRDYPYGTLAAHSVGYLGEISEEQLADPRWAHHRAGDVIGWAGIEQQRETDLRGRDGVRRLEVDARGRVLRDLGDTPPTPGADVRLTLDLAAQQLAEDALAEGILAARQHVDTGTGPGRGGRYRAPAGAVVVLDPRNGEILALASHPTFEPFDFVGGVSQLAWDRLHDRDNHHPLINRAVQSSYPPGSVFKVVPVAAALEEGYVGPDDTLPCAAQWTWNRSTYRNWNRGVDEGPMTLAHSLVRSCDTVFYELARRMWSDEQAEGDRPRERLGEQARAWGLGAPTGVDLPSERAGVVPGRAWKLDYWERTRTATCAQARSLDVADPDGYQAEVLRELCDSGFVWRGGDSVNMSIGQGDVQTTPLQIANVFAAIANRGTLHTPHLTKEVLTPDGRVEPVAPPPARALPVSAAHLDYIHRGLVGVNEDPTGTAAATFRDFPVSVAGKTGTAEHKPKQPIAWYAGYAPAEDPRYVVVAMVEEGGGGSSAAAPIVRRIFEGLFPESEPGEIVSGEDAAG
jgi:penicillin-binding protein 2